MKVKSESARIVKFIESESTLADAMGGGCKKRRQGDLVFNGDKVSV